MYQLRPYQEDAVNDTFQYLEEMKGNPCLCLATGSGKSLILAEIIRRWPKDQGILLLSHRAEILKQNLQKIQSLLPLEPIGIYSATLKQKRIRRITVAQVQSFARKAKDVEYKFSLIIIDENHLVSHKDEGIYQKVLKEFPKARVVGLTATPKRLDSGSIVGEYKTFTHYSYTSDMRQLIKDGYLSPLVGKSSVVQADMSEVKLRGQEYILSEALKTIDIDGLTRSATDECLKFGADRKHWIVFCTGVQHAENVSRVFAEKGITNRVITGDTIQVLRETYFREFESGKIRALVNVDVLCLDEKTEILTLEGWQSINTISMSQSVACWESEKVFFAPPKLIVKRERSQNEKMVSIKSNAVDIRVTSNHRMVVYQGLQNKTKITPARELIGKVANLPAHGEAEPIVFQLSDIHDIDTAKQTARKIVALKHLYKKKYKLTDSEARNRAEKEILRKKDLIPLLPHELSLDLCFLIGFWIGDGSRGTNKSSGADVISLSQSFAYPDNIKIIEDILVRENIPFNKRINKPACKTNFESVHFILSKGTGSHQQSRSSGVFKILPYLKKEGSPLFHGLSKDQFSSLLKGLWTADGLHHSSYKRNAITSISKSLLDNLQSVATCRGIRTSLRKLSAPRKETHRQQWMLSWDLIATRIRTYKKRFVEENNFKNEKVWCVTSETGTLITRRNGKVAVVGNTTGFDAPYIDMIVLLRATKSVSLYCLSEDSEILTKEGFKGIDQISKSDIVCAPVMESLAAEWLPINEIVNRERDKDEYMVEYNSPHLDISVSNLHDMIISTPKSSGTYSENKKVKAENLLIRKSEFKIPVSCRGKFNGVSLTDSDLAFLGWFLTDGTLNKKTNAISITQSERYLDNIAHIKKTLDGCNFKYGEHVIKAHTNYGKYEHNSHIFSVSFGKPRGTFKDRTGWSRLLPFINKEIPESFNDLTEAQFEILLDAIHRGNGAKQPNGVSWRQRSYHISSDKLKFADNLQALAIVRGWMCHISVETVNRNKPLYLIHLKKQTFRHVGGQGYKDRPVFKKNKNYNRRVWCVSNHNGTLVIRRNGKVFIGGNCQILGRGMRPHPTKLDGCLVLDFAGNLKEHGPIDEINFTASNRERKKGEASEEEKKVPAKICENCRTLCATAAKECLECGFIFPERVVVHSAVASNADPLSYGVVKPRQHNVTDVAFSLTKSKKSGIMMVVVNYYCGLNKFTEYLLFNHEGYAKEKTLEWWKRHTLVAFTQPRPLNSEEAYSRIDREMVWPDVIWVKSIDGRDQVISREIKTKKQSVWSRRQEIVKKDVDNLIIL